jgi:acyl-homoserine lactone acylase PvdQ
VKRACVLAVVTLAVGLALGPASGAPRNDYAAVSLNVLPPGQGGSFDTPPSDQLRLYDGLTPLFDGVKPSDVARYFKPARFGLNGARPTRVVRPRAGLRIERDRWDVPHVYGQRRSDVMFGAGWVTAADRGLLMNLLRGPGRLAALDAPGIDPFALVGSGRTFVPTGATEAFLARQIDLVLRLGAEGRQLVRDVDAYVAGINAYNRANDLQISRWTRNDVVAVAALIGARFGSGGGDEVRRSQFLDALVARLGPADGRAVWDELRAWNEVESPVSVERAFRYGTPAGAAGSVKVDDGSFEPAFGSGAAFARRMQWPASNALLVAGRRSATGRPLLVAGPQVGYYYPQILLELDLHGGGIDARGAAFPGISLYVLIGRGIDFAWSATSAGTDNSDEFAEELCGDDTHYRFRGQCRTMETVDAGVLRGGTQPEQRIVFRETVHGPVTGYATVEGRRVAISLQRSTRGRARAAALFYKRRN